MASFNRVVLVGNLTRDVEFKAVSADFAVGNFGLAVNERRKDKGGQWVDEANFFDCEAFNKTAEVLRDYTQKGSQVLIEGRLKQDTWEQDGQKRSRIKIVVEKLVLLGKKDGSSEGSGTASQPSQARQTATSARGTRQRQQTEYVGGSSDDIPF